MRTNRSGHRPFSGTSGSKTITGFRITNDDLRKEINKVPHTSYQDIQRNASRRRRELAQKDIDALRLWAIGNNIPQEHLYTLNRFCTPPMGVWA